MEKVDGGVFCSFIPQKIKSSAKLEIKMPLSLMDVFGTSKPTQENIDERRAELRTLRKGGLISPTIFKNQTTYINRIEETLLDNQFNEEIKQTVKNQNIKTKRNKKLENDVKQSVKIMKTHEPFTTTTSVKGVFTSSNWRIGSDENTGTLVEVYACMGREILKHLTTLIRNGGQKTTVAVEVKFSKTVMDKEVFGGLTIEYKIFWLTFPVITLRTDSDIKQIIKDFPYSLDLLMDKIELEGSGWEFHNVLSINVKTARFVSSRAGTFVELPDCLKNKKALINVNNSKKLQNRCFELAVCAGLFPTSSGSGIGDRVSSYTEHLDKLNMKGIESPVKESSFNKFCSQQTFKISLSLYAYENNNDGVFPLRVSETKEENHINLLIYQNHYVLIKSFDRLLNNRKVHSHSLYHCDRCLHGYSGKKLLEEHNTRPCDSQKTKMPEGDDAIHKFSNERYELFHPFIIYADFESLTEPLPLEKKIQVESGSWTNKLQVHKPLSWGAKVVSSVLPEYETMNIKTSEDTISSFLTFVKNQTVLLTDRIKNNHIMTGVNWKSHNESKNCYSCKNAFTEENYKVKDHCHLTGTYRGAMCNECNLKLRVPDFIPVVFHNLRGYDSHLIIKEIGKSLGIHDELQCIPNTMDKYLSFTWIQKVECVKEDGSEYTKTYKARFIDSLAFMASSLDSLVRNLKDDEMTHTKKAFPENFELMRKKGVFPYDWCNSRSKLESTELPSIDKFYSKLYETNISDKEYDYAKQVWDKSGCKTMKDYMELYLKTDVALLCDVFETFRKTCFKNYKLDPAHCFSSPQLAWASAMKMTGVKLGLIEDQDMYQMVEAGQRGGISMISHRYGVSNVKKNNMYNSKYSEDTFLYVRNVVRSNGAKDEEHRWFHQVDDKLIDVDDGVECKNDVVCVPNKENCEDFDCDKPVSYLIYVDANNLYGKAMSEKLPVDNYKWDNKTIDETLSFDADGEEGLILEYDLEYPVELHDLHSAYPMACESVKIEQDMLSPYTADIYKKFNMGGAVVAKLVPNLNNKSKYVSHIKTLQFYVKHGLKLTKVHRVISFRQSAWLEPYIRFNTEKRAKCDNDFEKDFYKLMNNSVFGKTMENVRKRISVELVSNQEQALKIIAKPSYAGHVILSDELTAVHKKVMTVHLNKPIAVGAVVLELSKLHMLQYHYEEILPTYGADKVKLILTDTDSLVYQIETEDLYADMRKKSHLYDFSNYPKFHKNYNSCNKAVIGKFKDELGGQPMKEIVGLRSKMYSWNTAFKEKCVGKGIQKRVSKTLKLDEYKEVLETAGKLFHKMTAIRSKNHTINMIEYNKVSLSAYEDKRYMLEDGITSLPYGHYKIPKKI